MELMRLQAAWVREWQPVQQQGMDEIAAASSEVEPEAPAAPSASDSPAAKVPVCQASADTEAEAAAAPAPQDCPATEVPVIEVAADMETEVHVPASEAADRSPTTDAPAFEASADTEAEMSASPPPQDPTAEVPDQRACEGAHTAQQEARVRAADRQTLGSSGRAPAAVCSPDAAAVAAAAVTATPQDSTHDNHLESD